MTKQIGINAAMWVALSVPAAAFAQMTGVSTPEEVPAAATPEGAQQPLVYIPTPTAVQLRPRPLATSPNPTLPASAASYDPNEYKPYTPPAGASTYTAAAFNPDASIVGDPMPGTNALDLDAGVVTRIEGPANSLPQGTILRTRMLESLSTKSTVEGTEWRAELLAPVMRDGRVLLPSGAILHGRVTEIHGGKRIAGRALIHLETTSVTMPDGLSFGIHAQVIDTSRTGSTKVDAEGTVLHRDHHTEQAAVLALTAGSGAAAGAMMAGVPGALIGAGVGAGVSTAIWLKQDRQAELPRDTQVTFELTRAMIIGAE